MMTQFFHEMKYDLKGHIRPLLCQKHSSTFVYGQILMKNFMNANNMKTQFNIFQYDLKCYFMIWRIFVIFYLITTLNYALMDNFCPYLNFKKLAIVSSFLDLST